jgi:predicted O-methyltransferase YrrM
MTFMNEKLSKLGTKDLLADFNSNDFNSAEFDVYYGLAKLIRPKSILEVGVYKGYSACAMIYGALRSLEKYVGIDAELYIERSNDIARGHIMLFCEKMGIEPPSWRIDNVNTQAGDVDLNGEEFDWVHIDGAHETREAIKDILTFWPMTKRVMTVHDYESHPEVMAAVNTVIKDKLVSYTGGVLCHSSHGNYLLLKG